VPYDWEKHLDREAIMSETTSDLRLSRINTLWTAVLQANLNGTSAAEAQNTLLERYGGAVRRYLLGATRDSEAAAELFQEFAVLFLRGGLRGADPGRGRFRDYVKGVLFHLSADHHKKARRRGLSFGSAGFEPAVEPDAEREQAFLTSWRDELLARAWAALEEMEQTTGQPFFTVLRFKADNPEASSQEMAERLSRQWGKKLTAAGVRQTLHRARAKFADFLLDEIAHALAEPTAVAIEEELRELGLLEHCRPALERRGAVS
jgi:RNA polymerase sigma-70 factor (ECF subfamily)